MRQFPRFALPGVLRSGVRAGIESASPLLSEATLTPLMDAVPIVITMARPVVRRWEGPGFRLRLDAGGLMVGLEMGHKG